MEKPESHIDNQSTLLHSIVKAEPQQQDTGTMTLQPNFLKSIEGLSNLSTAILNFKRKFDDLNTHIEFIGNAIDAKFNQLPPQQIIQNPIPLATTTSNQQSDSPQKQTEIESEKPPSPARSHLEEVSRARRGLRKYLVDNLSNIEMLREQVPAFLKRVPEPARVVLDCIGKFYCQGIRAYAQDCPLIQMRQASVLMLELFLPCAGERSEEVKIVKEESDARAIVWKKRIVGEGGVHKASEIDARGLLLFIACFGIPREFGDGDVGYLILRSNLGEIQNVIRKSQVLLTRIPGIIKQMVKIEMNIEAAEIAYIFGADREISPQKILISLLENSRQKAKAAKGETFYLRLLKKQLADLRSVKKFIKKLDPAKLVPGWQIVKTIINLEKEIAELDKKIRDEVNLKRTYDQNEAVNQLKSQESKRARFSPNTLPYSPTVGFHEQNAAVRYMDSTRSLYNYATTPLTSYGSSLAENYLSAGRSVIDTGLTSRVSSGYDDLATPYTPLYGVNSGFTLSQQHHVLESASETRLARSYMEHSPTVERFPGLINSRPIGTSSDLYRFADTVSDSIGSSRAPSSSTYQSSYMYP